MIARLAIALLCVLAGLMAWCWLIACAVSGSPRFWRIAIAFDQAANAAIAGDENLTISTRAAIGARQGKRHWRLLCRLLDRVDPGHCENSLKHTI